MKSRHLRRVGALGAVAALGLTGLVSTGAQAQGGNAAPAQVATISMEQQGRNLFFEGPRSVDAGAPLEILNNTDPREIGPHTFSLVKQKALPEFSKEGFKECFKAGVCAQIFKAHRVDEKAQTVGRKVVRAGEDGWDTPFGKRGDSWFSLKQDQTFSQDVSAKAGDTLSYFCVIHPEMQGKIKVK